MDTKDQPMSNISRFKQVKEEEAEQVAIQKHDAIQTTLISTLWKAEDTIKGPERLKDFKV